MDAFIHKENLALFKKKLAEAKDKPLAKCCETDCSGRGQAPADPEVPRRR